MNTLVDLAISAHGGMDRRKRLSTVSAHLRMGGALWALTGNPDSTLDEYRDVRATLGKMTELIEEADEPAVVAEAVLTAALAAHPKLRYAAGGRASRLRWLRRFAPASLVDAGIRKNLQLDAATASAPRSAVMVKP